MEYLFNHGTAFSYSAIWIMHDQVRWLRFALAATLVSVHLIQNPSAVKNS